MILEVTVPNKELSHLELERVVLQPHHRLNQFIV